MDATDRLCLTELCLNHFVRTSTTARLRRAYIHFTINAMGHAYISNRISPHSERVNYALGLRASKA